MFDSGLKKSDIEQALGGDFAGTIPNNYRLVREAIDRGVPLDEVKAGNNITAQLKKMVAPQSAKAAAAPSGLVSRLGFSKAKSA
jgi:pilus assembly protein CpaE